MKYDTVKFGVLTWNCAGNKPNFNDISHVLCSNGEEAPDFYIIGLQEMVDLNVYGSVMSTKDVERM